MMNKGTISVVLSLVCVFLSGLGYGAAGLKLNETEQEKREEIIVVTAHTESSQSQKKVDKPITKKEINSSGNLTKNAFPIVREAPNYPIMAAKNKQTGWVKLSYDINRLGNTEKIEVIDAKPQKVFNRASINAVKKWKYSPKLVKGIAEVEKNVVVTLAFELNGKGNH